ncbi:MAG: class I tRNA ligase family protein [Candidatus Paceibacterota bacterium]
MADMEKQYNWKDVESRVYKAWEESGYFSPENSTSGEGSGQFSTIMPPPNANGRLHAGHALDMTLKDILTRYWRLKGKRALFLPGADHAGFETQVVYEKQLEKEGKSRMEMDRESLYKGMYEFTLENKQYMEDDVRALGASCDWSREKFTLDNDIIEKVRLSFVKLYEDGLVYRANRIVNWCTKHQTSLSDVETESEEREDMLYYIEYGPFTIATVRPETIFADVAIAVHPNDARYSEHVGKTVTVKTPIGEQELQVIADDYVDPEFGTGALKITPAHDGNDFEIGKRHNLPMPETINAYGKLTERAGKYAGMNIAQAREAVVADLESMGLLKKKEAYKHVVPFCYKCSRVIEPRIMDQWFVKMESFAKKALEALDSKKIDFLPGNMEKIFRYWMENTIDWNISRQIVWGIKIPVWYGEDGAIHLPKRQKFLLARHGESEANRDKVMGAQNDVALTDTGKEQALELAKSLKSAGISKIVHSPLSRSKESAQIIASELGVSDIEEWSDIAEVNAGEFAGKPIEGKNVLEAALESKDGEKLADLTKRAQAVIERMRAVDTEGTVLVVGHRSFTSVLMSVWAGRNEKYYTADRRRFTFENATYKELEVLIAPKGEGLTEETDVFDTWFSSGQWPYLALGYPDSSDFKTYYPTDVMETGADLIFKWVPRMVFMSAYFTGTEPFKTVYFHGMINDAKGQKMSKSKGNVLSPIELVDEFGADALRMSLVIGNPAGANMALSKDKVKAYRNFTTKIWNAARFVSMNWDESLDVWNASLSAEQQSLFDEFSAAKKSIEDHIQNFRLHLAGEELYHYFWHTFADKVIESQKAAMMGEDSAQKASALKLLGTLLKEQLILLHPFMPFVTEELYQNLPFADKKEFLMIESL